MFFFKDFCAFLKCDLPSVGLRPAQGGDLTRLLNHIGYPDIALVHYEPGRTKRGHLLFRPGIIAGKTRKAPRTSLLLSYNKEHQLYSLCAIADDSFSEPLSAEKLDALSSDPIRMTRFPAPSEKAREELLAVSGNVDIFCRNLTGKFLALARKNSVPWIDPERMTAFAETDLQAWLAAYFKVPLEACDDLILPELLDANAVFSAKEYGFIFGAPSPEGRAARREAVKIFGSRLDIVDLAVFRDKLDRGAPVEEAFAAVLEICAFPRACATPSGASIKPLLANKERLAFCLQNRENLFLAFVLSFLDEKLWPVGEQEWTAAADLLRWTGECAARQGGEELDIFHKTAANLDIDSPAPWRNLVNRETSHEKDLTEALEKISAATKKKLLAPLIILALREEGLVESKDMIDRCAQKMLDIWIKRGFSNPIVENLSRATAYTSHLDVMASYFDITSWKSPLPDPIRIDDTFELRPLTSASMAKRHVDESLIRECAFDNAHLFLVWNTESNSPAGILQFQESPKEGPKRNLVFHKHLTIALGSDTYLKKIGGDIERAFKETPYRHWAEIDRARAQIDPAKDRAGYDFDDPEMQAEVLDIFGRILQETFPETPPRNWRDLGQLLHIDGIMEDYRRDLTQPPKTGERRTPRRKGHDLETYR